MYIRDRNVEKQRQTERMRARRINFDQMQFRGRNVEKQQPTVRMKTRIIDSERQLRDRNVDNSTADQKDDGIQPV